MTDRPARHAARFPSIPDDRAETWTIPADDGIELRIYALHPGRANRPVLLWGHANGFAAGSYLPLLEQLAGRFRIFAFDARGHGGSGVPGKPFAQSLHLDRYSRDLGRIAAAVRDRIADAPLFYASHSFSGVAALRLGAVFGDAPWAGVTVFEPPLVPAPELPEHAPAYGISMNLVRQAARRRRRWASPAAFVESLRDRPPYAGFRPDMLEAHCRATLHPTGDGEFVLACDPEVEMATYRSVMNPSTFRALPSFRVPVQVVAGDPAPAGGPPSWAALVQELVAARLPDATCTVLRGCGHMMMFEAPDACTELTFRMLDGRREDARKIS